MNKLNHRKTLQKDLVPFKMNCKLEGSVRHMKRGQFLGKGSFACCFEFVDQAGKKSYAAKVITRDIISDKHQYNKVIQEAKIHSGLSHPNVVKLHDYFENQSNFYIMLELCSGRSMMELQRSRQTITETESRYFLKQIVSGVGYLHESKIIHRDLKLGNLLLSNEMVVKIADFGLAVHESDLKKCQLEKCGTPNYISPEMLLQKGHSYPVDVWAIGIVLYTLLVGTPPFETHNSRDTYHRIRLNEYKFPAGLNRSAKKLISLLLSPNPQDRPKVSEICKHEFIYGQYCPRYMPLSSVIAMPRVKNSLANETAQCVSTYRQNERKDSNENEFCNTQIPARYSSSTLPAVDLNAHEAHNISQTVSLRSIIKELKSFDKLPILHPSLQKILKQDDEYPAGKPIYWVTRWVDISKSYGICYQLSNNSIGFLFRDNTKLIVGSNGEILQYIDSKGNEAYYTFSDYPLGLKKKVSLLKSTREFILESLVASGKVMINSKGDSELERWPSIQKWCVNHESGDLFAAFCTSDGSLQVNFKQPHVKVIVSSTLKTLTFIVKKECFTYKLSHLCESGCPVHILSILKRVKKVAIKLLKAE